MPSRSSSPISRHPSSARALLSRIRTPFSSKSQTHLELDINPDDPHRRYTPGDSITGNVTLKVCKPVRVTHIVVSLVGYAQVYKTPNASGDGVRLYHNSIAAGKKRKESAGVSNGFTTLFDDEVVLCGEGRLAEGVYQFGFELLFPSRPLPSSIDFERGTVTYMIMSTMTRPMPMATTMTNDQKVFLIEDIDVGPLRKPKPSTILLEPVSRRARAMNSRRRARKQGAAAPKVGEGSEPRVAFENGIPGSPAPSDASLGSRFSSQGTDSARDSIQPSVISGDVEKASTKKQTAKKPIIAVVELTKRGYLRGDNIPIKVTVDHNKPVRSLRGIIITFYRKARVTMNPNEPESANDQDDKPRTKGQRHGLSISATGSNHVYRKDMAQTFAPLFVDPNTLKCEIKTAIRVPTEAFPTIASVPGAIISFKYFVEVVLDLHGKLTSLDRLLTNSGVVGVPNPYGPGAEMVPRNDGDGPDSYVTALGNNFIDTRPLLRERHIASRLFEVVVGTRDSERKYGRRMQLTGALEAPSNGAVVPAVQLGSEMEYAPPTRGGTEATPSLVDQDVPSYQGASHDPPPNHFPWATTGVVTGHADATSSPVAESSGVPLPNFESPPNGDEKARVRLAEQRLLPSQPPADQSSASSVPIPHMPSAPELPQDPAHQLAVPFGVHSHTLHNITPPSDPAGPSTPAPSAPPADDKQELERRRLENERSAPEFPPTGEEHETGDTLAGAQEANQPSAPSDLDIFGPDIAADGDLPQYER